MSTPSHASGGNRNMKSNSNSNNTRNNMRKKRENKMTYHYAGKVHVRGLLRRVWRPRYLALGDDGYLRYHESIPPLFQQDAQGRQPYDSHSNMYSLHNTHRPKTILAILDGARTIDPNSVVDQHVALPQGVYGFVFRGRPVELLTSDTPSSGQRGGGSGDAGQSQGQGALIVPPESSYNSPGGANSNEHKTIETLTTTGHSHPHKHSTKAAVVNLVFPKGTNRRRTAQKIAKKAINPDVLCAFGRANNCDGGISRSSSSSSLAGYEQPLTEEESGQEEGRPSNHEWGGDSHESHDTMGSFQEVERSQVCRDLTGGGARPAPNHQTHPNRERMSSSAATKSTVHVQVQASSIQSREYLCAVATAEEAESWVVGLRWAAEHRRRIRHENTAARRSEERLFQMPNTTLAGTAPNSGGNVNRDEQIINAGRDLGEAKKPSDIDNNNNNERYQSKSSSKSSSDTSEGNSGGESSTNKDSSDSKASLTSLLIEQDGWCKADEENRKIAEEVNEKARVKSETSSRRVSVPGPLPLSKCAPDEDPLALRPPTDESTPVQLEPPSTSIPKKQPSSPSGATIVVTKVSQFQMPQILMIGPDSNIPWFPFHFPLPGDDLLLQYEVQLLLLRNCKPQNESSVRPESIEERMICRTTRDVLALVHDLLAEFGAGEHGSLNQEDDESDPPTPQRKGRAGSNLQLDDTVHLLEDVESKILSSMNLGTQNRASDKSVENSIAVAAKGTIAELSSTMSKAMTSVSIFDDAMRRLSKDHHICASRHFQEFLCLHASHRHSSAFTSKSKEKSSPTQFSKGADAEQVVKTWLARTDSPTTMDKLRLLLAIILRHKFGGPILSLMAVWSTTRLASIFWLVVSGSGIIISIPLETYAALLALSFFFGHNIRASSQLQHDESHLEKQSSKGHEVKSPSSMNKPNEEKFTEETVPVVDHDHFTVVEDDHSTVAEDVEEESSESEDEVFIPESSDVSSPLPLFPANNGITCWSNPDHEIFMVRGSTYLQDRIKMPSPPAVFPCRGVDFWITDNAERNISRHPAVLGGDLDRENTFIVNFLLPFGNFVAYFTIPPIEEMPSNIANVWSKFIEGDQQYRDGKLKLLPVVVDGPWIVKKAVGPGTSPAMVGRDLPLQYYFTEPTASKKGVYEVDVLVTASRIARGILNVVKGHTKSLTIAFAFIIEASTEAQLPETVLCAFQVHSLHLEDCPNLPDCYPDG